MMWTIWTDVRQAVDRMDGTSRGEDCSRGRAMKHLWREIMGRWRFRILGVTALTMVVFTTVSFSRPLAWDYLLSDRNWISVCMSNGYVTGWYVSANRPFLIVAFKNRLPHVVESVYGPSWRKKGVGWQVNTPVLPPAGWRTSDRCFHSWIGFPLWVPLGVLLAFPTLGFLRHRVRLLHRRKRGLCPFCGYSLRGNVSGMCPECGTPFDPTLLVRAERRG